MVVFVPSFMNTYPKIRVAMRDNVIYANRPYIIGRNRSTSRIYMMAQQSCTLDRHRVYYFLYSNFSFVTFPFSTLTSYAVILLNISCQATTV